MSPHELGGGLPEWFSAAMWTEGEERKEGTGRSRDQSPASITLTTIQKKVLSHHLILQRSANWMEPLMNHTKCCTNIAEWLLVKFGEWPQDERILRV